MANPDHLKILKGGLAAWYGWRKNHPDIRPDLSEADLIAEKLNYFDLSEAYLFKTLLNSADLADASLKSANLRGAQLGTAHLLSTNFTNADLSHAIFDGANCSDANLVQAKLCGASLIRTNFVGANLKKVDFSSAHIIGTVFGDNDLSTAIGLDRVIHGGPSTIGIDTIYRSKGNIPEIFLRGCGAPDTFVTFARSLVNAAIDFYSCFISYSSNNHDFAERLYADLQSKGVRCWFAPEDLKIGDEFRQRIDDSIKIHDKLLLILSEQSISSIWVKDEVEAALERERRENRLVLFPVRIDDAIEQSNTAWAASLRRMRHIGDFSRWKDHDSYSKAFERLLRDLKAESQS